MTKEKLASAFAAVAEKDEKAFVAYIMAGDGGLSSLKEKILHLQEIGVTVVEIGIPFSDPVADGPVIQEAGQRALAQGVTLDKVLKELASFQNEVSIPLVVMTYLNPVYRYGLERFAEDCVKAGISGAIIPDVPLEEEDEIRDPMKRHSLALIRLVTLTSPESRIKNIAQDAEGFIYAVTVNGITGARTTFKENVPSYLKKIKELSPVPVLAGFGVSSSEQAAELGKHCDGVIVGSKIVELFHTGNQEAIREIIPKKAGQTVQAE
ncbi:tryptophan synthase alpha chain [Bacillus ectoiniformans]|uniref:tryptophan synthase subunit alpha n=1 Tax=Bacillus ectoiniformans TaxID=1494429 RepID=UPI00195BCA5B|nr:tryptophan synthase subunit alpha [Bacillus ectoiniformans]MBM7647742.1 tryptophan synthase alpha chain [Bacillus ectoiniformans]